MNKIIYKIKSYIFNEAMFEIIAIVKKIIIVEVYYGFKILSPYFPKNEYAIWPIRGVPYTKLSIGFAERISNNFKVLLDSDRAGRITEGNLVLSSDKNIFIRGKIFGGFDGDLEGLIVGRSGVNKHKVRRDILHQNKYQDEIKKIANKIKKTFS